MIPNSMRYWTGIIYRLRAWAYHPTELDSNSCFPLIMEFYAELFIFPESQFPHLGW